MLKLKASRWGFMPCLALAGIFANSAFAAPLVVTNHAESPHPYKPGTVALSLSFDKPVDPLSIVLNQTLSIFGRWSGAHSGSVEFFDGGTTLLFTSTRGYSAGENVMVILSHDVTATDATTLRSEGYSYQFWVRPIPANMQFVEIDRLTTRTIPSQSSRAYGGFASDLDADGWLDITIVNEDTADLRVFENRRNGTGRFFPFNQPTTPVGQRASPSEPGDFNSDGNVDVCVANINDDTVSVLLGNGDGTFAPQQLVAVGLTPRGVAVLDVDGDGDIDIVNTNADAAAGQGNLSILLNNGAGVFGAPTFFEGGITGEWALAAADMTNDGILDLVVGAQSGGRVVVLQGNGNGTFTPLTPRITGAVWMLNVGDVNGDGKADVAAVLNQINRGTILLGDGAGGLGVPTNYVTDAFPLATDLADLDGDGDLDWVTSSFAGDWFVFTNNGAGTFAFNQELPAATAASCSLPLDFDNDGDLDLALIDEIADEVVFMQNNGLRAIPAVSTWGVVATALLVLMAGTILLRHRWIAPEFA